MLEQQRYQYPTFQEIGCIPVLSVSIMSEKNSGTALEKWQTCIMPSCGMKKSNDLVDLYSIEVSAIMIMLEFDVSKLE